MGVSFFSTLFIIFLILTLFFLASKVEKWDSNMFSSFECGYSSYFFSRFSFSVHYFVVGLIFLFLDLEICLIMPLMNSIFDSSTLFNLMMFMVLILLLGLLYEWWEGQLEWKF